MENPLILIVEDDKNISRATSAILELQGYRVYCAGNLTEGKILAEKCCPDLIVLDILLPDGNGLDYCRTLREHNEGVRILFLSALNTKEDTINGLRAGGDDYLAKPYLTEEFLLRIDALLRRGCPGNGSMASEGPFTWNDSSLQVFFNGCDLELKPREYSVLEFLCREPGTFFSAEEIYREVWNADPSGSLSPVHNHIYGIRRKLKDSGVKIEFIRSRGYRIIF
jgi:DNA-binding response OmpR family regulator